MKKLPVTRLVISVFLSIPAFALALGTLESSIRGPRDLENVTVGTVPGSSSEEYLRRSGITFERFGDVVQALHALDRGDIGAVLYDAPIPRYLTGIETQHRTQVLPELVDRESYAFALPSESTLRELLNQELLQVIDEPEWAELLRDYLGE